MECYYGDARTRIENVNSHFPQSGKEYSPVGRKMEIDWGKIIGQ